MSKLLCALAIVVCLSARLFAGSEEVAVGFAVATPTTYTWNLSYKNANRSDGTDRFYLYRFTTNAQGAITALAVVVLPSRPGDPSTTVTIPANQPLTSIPFPQSGTMENVSVNVDAFDSSGQQPVAAGHATSYYDQLYPGSSILAIIDPASILSWVPFAAPGGATAGYTLVMDTGGASCLTTQNGETGFYVTINPSYPNFGYQIIGPNGSSIEWGSLDPANLAIQSPGQPIRQQLASGVALADLRSAPLGWKVIDDVIDGWVNGPPDAYGRVASVPGEAVAIRCSQWTTVRVQYNGPPASIVVREVDEQGQVTRNYDQTPREWWAVGTVPSGTTSSFAADVPLVTGRAVLVIYPAGDTSSGSTYQLLVGYSPNQSRG